MSTNSSNNPEVLPEPGMTRLGPFVAYEFGVDGYAHGGLLVWHFCDHHLWEGRSHFDAHREEYHRWTPGAVGGHDLINTEPLHLEPSVYWPDCCGMHGFIRDGKWFGV